MGAIRYLSNDPKGAPSLAPTLAAASGHLDLGDGPDPREGGPRIVGEGGSRMEAPGARETPRRSDPDGAPSTGPGGAGPLARSKSQLTLLLEKDRGTPAGKRA